MRSWTHHALSGCLMAAALFAFAGLPAPVEAQPRLFPRIEVMAGGGATFPINEFGDNAKTGYLYLIEAGWRFAPATTAGISFQRSVLEATDQFRMNNNVAPGAKAEFTTWNLSVYFKQMAFEAAFRPYIRIQMGAIDIDPNVDGKEISVVDVKFAMSGGFGLQWKDRWPIGAYTEFLYHQAMVKEEDPLTDSDRRQFLTWNFGLSYDFL